MGRGHPAPQLQGSSVRQGQRSAVRLLIESCWHTYLNEIILKGATTLMGTFPMAVKMSQDDVDPAGHVAPLRAIAPRMAISSSFLSLATGSMPAMPLMSDFKDLIWPFDDTLESIL